jgi:hypothetical protein
MRGVNYSCRPADLIVAAQLMFIDYQDHVLDVIFAQDRRVIELNVRTLAKMAVAWGDPKFVTAVKATGRKRLVMCGISTSACLTYPVVSALALMSGERSPFCTTTKSRVCNVPPSIRRHTALLSRKRRERQL